MYKVQKVFKVQLVPLVWKALLVPEVILVMTVHEVPLVSRVPLVWKALLVPEVILVTLVQRDPLESLHGPPGPRGRQGEPGDTAFDREVFNRISAKFDTVIREVNSTLFDVVWDIKTSSQTALNAVMTELKLINKTLNTLKQMNAVTKCGISGNWRRIAHLDTTQGDTCPSNLRTATNTTTGQTACGRTTGQGCTYLNFTISNDYSNVCGRVRGYQYFSMDAFDLSVTQSNSKSASRRKSIDGYYVDGVSITQGQPLRHLWTYAVGVSEYVSSYSCPCAMPTGRLPTNPPEFVGDNYYCESGFPGTNYNRIAWEDPLWDGHNCMARNSCCERYGWFHRQVPPSSDDITLRLCSDEHINSEDVLIDQFEIWVM